MRRVRLSLHRVAVGSFKPSAMMLTLHLILPPPNDTAPAKDVMQPFEENPLLIKPIETPRGVMCPVCRKDFFTTGWTDHVRSHEHASNHTRLMMESKGEHGVAPPPPGVILMTSHVWCSYCKKEVGVMAIIASGLRATVTVEVTSRAE
jgi:hypothetical protein